MIPSVRYLHLRGATGPVLTEQWNGREHLIVPCVALQEGVIHAVNAQTPEFVSASSLTKAASSWNGRPLVLGHPTKDGKQVSANDPIVLASHGFGLIRASRMNGTRLGMEALVDPARLEALGHQKLLADLRAGKQIEVSVGAFVTTNGKAGTHNGRSYKEEWVDVTGDHLAFLPNGVGACSLEMGCGAHRAAMHLVTAEEFKVLGAQDGHPFYGNQYTDGIGGDGGPKDGGGRFTNDAAGNLRGHQALVAQQHINSMIDRLPKDKQDEVLKKAAEHMKMIADSTVDDEQLLERTHSLLEDVYRAKGASAVEVRQRTQQILEKGASSHKKEMFLRKARAPKALGGALRTLECPHLETIRVLLDEVATIHAEVDEHAEALYADEEAGKPVDVARLEAVETLAMTMSTLLSQVTNVTYKKRVPNLPELDQTCGASSKYMEAFRAAIGKEISAKNAKTIQSAHDASHGMHDHTRALGAECDRAWKWLSESNSEAAAGGPQLKAACSCEGETNMALTKEKKAELIAAIVADAHSGFKTGDEPFLETAAEARLEEFRTAAAGRKADADAKVKAEKDLLTANARLTVIEGKLKVAEAAPTEEEWLAKAPGGIKTLLENQKAQETEMRDGLIKELKVAGANTEEELKAMPIAQLQTLAKYAKVQAPDFSGRGLPVRRDVPAGEDFTPPDPYATGIKTLQERSKTVN